MRTWCVGLGFFYSLCHALQRQRCSLQPRPLPARISSPETGRLVFAELSWSTEEYHRDLKQFTGVERCQIRSARGQRNHIGLATRAFVRLEYHRFTTGISSPPRPSSFETPYGPI